MARTEGLWKKPGSYISPTEDVPIVLENDYLNFGGLISGDIGYGIRNEGGIIQIKNLDGNWTNALGGGVTVNWWHYIGSTKYQDTTVTLAGGDVLTYTYTPTSTTVYRYITTALTGLYPTEDAFYTAFDGVTLSGLIVTR